ncbi:MAG TPA: hypothetical protein VF649_12210 [Sphingomonas sp.]|uniref:hypothetical protein n=1 Tax=Sphingomonas sp. TaxID=28214 RepID=UPI002EDACC3F
MSEAALQTLADAQLALIAALDAGDADEVGIATAAVDAALTGVRAVGGWRDRRDLIEQLELILKRSEAGRIRALYHRERARRDLSAVAMLRRPVAVAGYGPTGRFRLDTF